MSRIARHGEASRGWKRAVVLLALANLALLGGAITLGGSEVRDGSGSITNGWVVAAGIAGTALVALAVRWAPLPPALVAQVQAFALGAQALHATGHLARLYYDYWFYDDLLHAGLVFAIGMLLIEIGRLPRPPFGRLAPIAFAAMVLIGALAAAGLWEIFEFVMDVTFGTREQDNLVDTMQDMLDGLLGGSVAAALAWRAVVRERRARELGDAYSDELLD